MNSGTHTNSNEVPIVSIIIPIWNRAAYVHRIVDYLLEQTYKDFEVLFILYNESIDDSIATVNVEMKRLPRGRLITVSKVESFSGARDYGVKESEGRFLWFLDIDDRPLPDFLKCLMEIQSKHDADIVISNFVYSRPESTIVDFDDDLDVMVMSRTEALIARSQEIIPVPMWSKIFRKELIVENNLTFIKGFSEDIYYTYYAIDHSKIVCFCNRPMYRYTLDADSVTNADATRDARGWSEIMAYDELENYFSADREFFPMFRIRSSLIRLRSSGHMTYEGFMSYAKSERCIDMIDRNLRSPLSFESIWYRLFPRMYYIMIQLFFKFEYYKDGRVFYKKHRWYNNALMGWNTKR